MDSIAYTSQTVCWEEGAWKLRMMVKTVKAIIANRIWTQKCSVARYAEHGFQHTADESQRTKHVSGVGKVCRVPWASTLQIERWWYGVWKVWSALSKHSTDRKMVTVNGSAWKRKVSDSRKYNQYTANTTLIAASSMKYRNTKHCSLCTARMHYVPSIRENTSTTQTKYI